MFDHQKLKTMVKRIIDQTLRLRNFEARHGRIETEAVVTSRRGPKDVEKGQGKCLQWEAKGQCSRGDKCSFWHDEDERAKMIPRTPPPSESPTQRGRSASGHTAAGLDFTEEHKGLGTNSTSTIHKSYTASCKHPRKQGSVLRKIKSKFIISAVPTLLKFEDRSQEEIERQEPCARGDAWRLAKNIYKLRRNGQSYVLLTNQRMVSSSAIRNKTGGKRVCGGLRSKHAYGEQDRPELCRTGNRKGL